MDLGGGGRSGHPTSPPAPTLQTIALNYCLGTSFCSIMFWTLSSFNTNSAKNRLPCTFSLIFCLISEFVSWFLSLLSSLCVQCVVFGVGASTRVSWQNQQYFEENHIVRHPPKAIHPEMKIIRANQVFLPGLTGKHAKVGAYSSQMFR